MRLLLEGDARNVVLAPDRLADVNGMEIVEAEIESVRQLFGFEGKLDAKAKTRNIVNQTRVDALILNHDLCGMVSPGTLYSSVFHLTIRSLRSEPPEPVPRHTSNTSGDNSFACGG